MTIRSALASDVRADRVAAARRRARLRACNYRLAVLGTSVEDVVRHAGGLTVDLVLNGWDVTVLVADDTDARALDILGTDVLDLESALARPGRSPWPHVAVVAAELYERDDRLRDAMLETIDAGPTELVLWGDPWPVGSDHETESVQHRLSGAAQAFKTHALHAAHCAHDSVSGVEGFRRRAVESAVPIGLTPPAPVSFIGGARVDGARASR
ncbi:hypothetical protein [Nocardia aurea]|uniref:SAM-dependent methyltransferase n=1 Tax=Nocardia aurea TaxID=2144174 RepID=A0ABV3FSM1_9NOCA